MASLSCGGPSLDVLKDLVTDVLVDSSRTDGFQQGDEVIHKLSGGNFGEEVLAPILNARICKLHGKLASKQGACWALGAGSGGLAYIQRAQLGVWVLIADAFLQRAHGFFGLDGLGSNDIGYLEVKSYVLPATHMPSH